MVQRASASSMERKGAKSSASPEPDQDVLAYIQAQQARHDSTLSEADVKKAEQLKMERFQHGTSKVKSRYQREKEELERKKQQEELDAAHAYSEFAAAMNTDGRGTRKARTGATFVASDGKAYVGTRAIDPLREDDTSSQQEPEVSHNMPKEPAVKRKRAALNSFLSELQEQQAERESRLSAVASSSGTSVSTLLAQEGMKSSSRAKPTDTVSTNVCVLNMPFGVQEFDLVEYFSVYGDIAMVKVMTPRGGETRDRATGPTGFVAFMTRQEAEHAFQRCDGADWDGMRIKLSWGKSMTLPTQARYPKQEGSKPKGASARSTGPTLVIRHRKPQRSVSELFAQRLREEEGADLHETVDSRRLFIETVASRVRSHGRNFESVLRTQEATNRKFAFLDNPNSTAYQYFRYCIDPSVARISTTFADDEICHSTDSGEASETGKLSRSATTLGHLARRRLHTMLEHLTLRRERIARIMAFAIDHAIAHLEITDILTTSLLEPTTPIPRKLARLYCLSDILHNSGMPVPNVWKYRGAIEQKLPLVFGHLAQIVHAFPGRLKQEALRAQFMSLLHVWESWLVVSPPIMVQLRSLLQAAPKPVESADVPNEMDSEEDLDGEAM